MTTSFPAATVALSLEEPGRPLSTTWIAGIMSAMTVEYSSQLFVTGITICSAISLAGRIVMLILTEYGLGVCYTIMLYSLQLTNIELSNSHGLLI